MAFKKTLMSICCEKKIRNAHEIHNECFMFHVSDTGEMTPERYATVHKFNQ